MLRMDSVAGGGETRENLGRVVPPTLTEFVIRGGGLVG